MKETEFSRLEDETIQAYLALGDAIRAAILPEWVVADLSISQLKALMLLAYHDALSVSELARLLKMGVPAASILVQQLVDQALAERSEDPHDRRRALVRLTPRGSELISGRHKQTETKLRRWLGQLSEAELAALAHGLSVLVNFARADEKQTSQAGG